MSKLLLTDMRNRYLVERGSKIYVQEGVIDLKTAKSCGVIKTHLGKEYFLLKPEFLDLLAGAKRGPQVILPKDVGAILAHTNINKKSTCIDAGTGSGWFAMQLARFVKQVYTYEIRPEHAEVAKQNFEDFKCKNIKLKQKDAAKGFDEKNVDLIVLDMLNPEKVPFDKSLRLGGYCIAYVPHIEQAQQFVGKLPRNIKLERILEVREEEFDLSGKHIWNKIRHTAFLVFVRKVSESF